MSLDPRFSLVGWATYYNDEYDHAARLSVYSDDVSGELFWAEEGYCTCCGPEGPAQNDLTLIPSLESFAATARKWARRVAGAGDLTELTKQVDSLIIKVLDELGSDRQAEVETARRNVVNAREELAEITRIETAFNQTIRNRRAEVSRLLADLQEEYNRLVD